MCLNAVELRMEFRLKLISLSQVIESIGGYTTESVTHGQCDARPTVTFPGRYQFILLGEQRHIVCEQLATKSLRESAERPGR